MRDFKLKNNVTIEVTDEVFLSKYNKSIEQAGNRMHSIKAVILATLGY